ncbi:MAG TPA: hypothetical protein VK308_11500, partial [Pyrinomonadaceae bacterium]|nr:hypothetical protein [Pyrinomonadaceae bacterium]
MKNEVRFGHEVVSDATEKDNQSAKVNADFLSLAEEVRARSQKPKTTPLQIPQKLAPAEFNTAMVHFYRGEV